MGESKDETCSCSFCGKDKYQVKKLLVGKSADHVICDECILQGMIMCFDENYSPFQQHAKQLFAELKGIAA